MNTFLWTMAIVFLVEVGASIGYMVTGKVPERTMIGVAINAVISAVIAYWAISLIGGQQ